MTKSIAQGLNGETGSAKPVEDPSVPICCIGASAGGVDALKSLIMAIPERSGLTFVVMQHLDPDRKSLMPEIAEHWTRMPVVTIQDHERLLPDQLYLTPPGHLITFTPLGVRLMLPDSSQRHFSPIDVMLNSLAERFGARSIGVILSGSGRDGASGLKAIREKGGIGVVQEPGSAAFDGMPRAALETAGADLLLPPAEIPAAVIDLLTHARNPAAAVPTLPLPVAPQNRDALLETVLNLAAARKGSVLQGYKKTTLRRRVERRMQLKNIPTITGYLELLEQKPEELDLLIQDLLVGVTGFFRDREAYQILERQVVPRLFVGKDPLQPVRVWVAGCATGEEAYSIAMLLHEFRENAGLAHPVQIFATDLDDTALDEARTGYYREDVIREIEPQRLARFFTRHELFFHIKREVRESVVFASHNLLSDPPFSRMDLVVCRNVFIYLEQDAQKKLLSVFRFVLNKDGHLFLGSSESLGQQAKHFEAVSKAWRIYRHQGKAPNRKEIPLLTGNPLQRLSGIASLSVTGVASMERIYRTMLENHGPAMVLTSLEGEAIHVSGNTRAFLMVPHGEPQNNIIAMVKPEVRSLLSAAMVRVAQENRLATTRTHPDGNGRATRVTISPISPHPGERLLLITLAHEPGEISRTSYLTGEAFLVQQLEQELRATRDDLQRTIEQLRSSNEELIAFNEETIAMNEELQSANEELESSKEELQSLNEELSIANATLDAKVVELELANDDLSNLFSSTDTAILFLDLQLRIKRFTPAATRLMRLIPGDVGRPMTDIVHNLTGIDPLADAHQVLADHVTLERDVRDQRGHWYLMRTMPYRTARRQVDGLIVTFTDVSVMKAAEERDHATVIFLQDQARLLSRAHLLVCDLDHHILMWNIGVEEIYGWRSEEAVGRVFYELLRTEFPKPLPEIMADLAIHGHWQGDLVHHTRDQKVITIFSHWRLTPEGKSRTPAVVQVNNDTAEHLKLTSQLRQAKEAAEVANQAKSDFLANVSHEIRTPMNVVLGMSELLLETEMNPLQRRFVQTMHHSNKALLKVINDVLDFSRIEAGCLSLTDEPFSPRRMVEETVQWMRIAAEEKGLVLEVRVAPSVPEIVIGDDDRIGQILINLLGNAIKFTHQGKVSLNLEQSEPGTLHFTVIDTGIGIPPEQLEHIFEQFTQADAGITRSYGGSGLGLAISRRLVEMMGGRIRVESVPGQGSAFTCTLPLRVGNAAVPDAATPEESNALSGAKGLRILLAEDVNENRILFEAFLMDTSHRLIMVCNGLEAVARVQAERFDVVIMDIQMPIIDGYTATRQIRQWERESGRTHVPIVALSANALDGERQRSQEAGCDLYLTKPITRKALLDLLKRLANHTAPAAVPLEEPIRQG
ncbi:MAG: PAS domain-containing protein [Magnetococcales bacterium]|nr:PAS domain-containing protein [Magnetococcales bacterium]